MNEIIPQEIIENKIYVIRRQKVMLDKDLATLYGVKPIRLREQVKRNIKRFPSDFMLQLKDKEIDFMVSQSAIPSRLTPAEKNRKKHYVTTEWMRGVGSLSSLSFRNNCYRRCVI